MGIEKFVVDSSGTAIENPKHLDKTIERIKLLQRKQNCQGKRKAPITTINSVENWLRNTRN